MSISFSKGRLSFTLTPARAGDAVSYTEVNTPFPTGNEYADVDWVANFVVQGGESNLTIDGDLPEGKHEIIIVCRINDNWQKRSPIANRKWSLPPGDPAVGVR